MSRLSVSYRHDPDPHDDFGWLGLIVETEKFNGSGGFWVQWQDVDELAASIPLSPERLSDPITVQWGYNKQEADDLIVRLAISPHGRLGELLVEVELADLNQQQDRVRVSFKTAYAALDLFKHDLTRMMKNEIEYAELLGRETT